MKLRRLNQETQSFAVGFSRPNQRLPFLAGDAEPIAEIGNGLGVKGNGLPPQLIELGRSQGFSNQNN
jgi:hypothetical protein